MLEQHLDMIQGCFTEIPLGDWTEPQLRNAFERLKASLPSPTREDNELNNARVQTAVNFFLRWAMTGGRPGPFLISTMSILGRNVSLQRLQDASALVKSNASKGNEGS